MNRTNLKNSQKIYKATNKTESSKGLFIENKIILFLTVGNTHESVGWLPTQVLTNFDLGLFVQIIFGRLCKCFQF